MSFGIRLKGIRKRLNLSQAEMAAKLLMDQSSFSRYESGKTSPTIEIVKRVSDIFNVSIVWLLEIGEPDHKHKSSPRKKKQSNHLDNEIIQFMLEQQKKINELLNKFGDR